MLVVQAFLVSACWGGISTQVTQEKESHTHLAILGSGLLLYPAFPFSPPLSLLEEPQ